MNNKKIYNLLLSLSSLMLIAGCSSKYNYQSEKESSSNLEVEDYNQLFAPNSIDFNLENKKLTWSTVSGANYYDIKIQGEDSTGKNISANITNNETNSYTVTTAYFTKFFETGNKVLISVRAKTTNDDNAIYSNYISYLYDPTNHSDLVQFTYTINNDNSATITGFSQSCSSTDKKNLVIPETIGGHKVTKIGDYAFVSDKKYISTVEIASTIEEIGAYAFSSVDSANKTSSIEKVTFADNSSLKVIGEGAFYSLSSIKNSFTIPNSVEVISDSAFYSCPNIPSIDIDLENSSLKEIGNYAFYSNTKLESINIPKNLNSFGQYVFQKCTKLKTINFSSNINIEEIGAYTFAGTSISSIVIPSSVKTIKEGAFSSCSSLSCLFFNEDSKIEEIQDNAFASCARLRYLSTIKNTDNKITIDDYDLGTYESYSIAVSTITSDKNNYYFIVNNDQTKAVKIEKNTISLPSSIKSIGDEVFSGCKQIAAFKLASDSNLTHIGASAFKSCNLLAEFDVASKLEYIGDDAFNGCKALDAFGLEFPTTLQYISLSSFTNTKTTKEGTLVINNILVSYDGNDTTIDLTKLGTIKYISKEVFKGKDIESINLTGVEKIYDGAFSGCDSLKEINLPSTINYLGNEAFLNCKIAKITLDLSNLTYIGDSCFKNANSEASEGNEFETISFGNKLESIGASAFEGVTNLKTVTFAEDSIIESIGEKAFYNDSNITSISFPASLKSIGDEAFASKSSAKPALASISFATNSNVEYIGEKAFSNNINLQGTITLPSNVKEINQKTFEKCGSNSTGFELVLTSESQLETICKNAFVDSGLTKINLINSIKNVEEYAFSGCNKLNSVTFESDFYKDSDDFTLNEYVFEECSSLTSINLPQYIYNIADNAFNNCTNLETINSSASEIDVSNNAFTGTKFASGNNGIVIFNKVLLSYNPTIDGNPTNYNSETDSYSMIDLDLSELDIVKINDGAFYYNPKTSTKTYSISRYIQSVILPSSLKEISSQAFENCYYLESVTFNGNNLEIIGDEAFANCQLLTSIDLPDSVTSIGNKAFYQCKLSSVVIPSNVETIGDYAFANNGTIKELYVANPDGWEYSSYSLTSFTFKDGSKLEAIGSYALNNNNVKEFSLPDCHVTIGDYAFANSYQLESIDILTNYDVGVSILYGCNCIKDITIPGNVSLLGLFGGTSNSVPTTLKEITISDGSTSIADSSFNGCGNIEKINLPDSITSIGSYAFFGCRNIKELNCSNVVSFKEGAFIGCVNLDTISLSSSITYIGKNAFMSTGWLNNFEDEFIIVGKYLLKYNGNAKEVVVPDSIEYICGGAFAGNNDVEMITVGTNIKKIDNGAFDSCSNLSNLTINSATLCEIELEIFDTLTNFKIYVKDKSLYTDDIYWSLYEDLIEKM